MKKYLSIILLLYCNFCFAQDKTEYANFIQTDTAVKWAAIYNSYISLTPVNPNFNIRNFYISKLKKQGAIAYAEENGAFAVTPVTISYADYVTSIKKVNYDDAKMNWWFRYDTKENAAEPIFNNESNACDTCTIKNNFSFFKVKQLLCYSNNRLSVQNILVTPVIYKKNSKEYKEKAEYFETKNFAFNEVSNNNNSIPAAAKFIGRSCNNLVLLPTTDPLAENKILTLTDWNLCHILYRDIKQNKLQAYATDKSLYPDSRSVLDHRKIDLYKNAEDEVTVYDSLGNMVGIKKIILEVNFDSIYNFTLIQDLYFDFTKEKLYSKLIALVPRLQVITSSGTFIGYTNYWGVIFPKEKSNLTKKPK